MWVSSLARSGSLGGARLTWQGVAAWGVRGEVSKIFLKNYLKYFKKLSKVFRIFVTSLQKIIGKFQYLLILQYLSKFSKPRTYLENIMGCHKLLAKK